LFAVSKKKRRGYENLAKHTTNNSQRDDIKVIFLFIKLVTNAIPQCYQFIKLVTSAIL
jgi:hypothetical protein